jgi:hypothetical protein
LLRAGRRDRHRQLLREGPVAVTHQRVAQRG